MKHGSLFSGIGGFDLAAEWMGWENIFHCEWNEFGQKVLKYYWSKSISYGDITKTDFTPHRGDLDIISGGFPCQPYSSAGRRKGKEDSRHLWPEMLRAIREIQPRWVVGENVRGLTNWNGGMVFDEVQADLEAQGFEVLPFLLPACSVNAPHRRDRIWFVAHKQGIGDRTCGKQERSQEYRGVGSKGLTANANNPCKSKETSNGEWPTCSQVGQRDEVWNIPIRVNGSRDVTNTNGRRQSGKEHREKKSGFITETGSTGNWQDFPTQSPVCSRDDGLPAGLAGITFPKHRNESIKGYGNAVVPQLVFQIFKAIEQYNQTKLF